MPKSNFQPVRKESLAEEIAAQVRKEILRGSYRPGERLPSERELALQFGVNRTTVREALQKLHALGLVAIRQGSGVEVLDYHRTGKVDLLVHLLTTPDAEGRYDGRALAGVLELAQSLYKQAMRLAFERMGAGEIERLKKLLERQLTITDVDEFIARDAEIHQSVFDGTKNAAFQLLFNTFREIYETYASPFRIFMESELAGAGRFGVVDFYRRALSFVEKRDVAGVEKLIDEIFRPRDPKLFEQLMKQYTF